MGTITRAVQFILDGDLGQHIESKLKRIDYAADYLVDLAISLTRDARQFDAEAHLHFLWDATKNVTAHETRAVADHLPEKLFTVFTKEKDEHRINPHAAQAIDGHC